MVKSKNFMNVGKSRFQNVNKTKTKKRSKFHGFG